ncbi:hypothetical protein P692DRAFT_20830505 [Suillus brevipes Sb2]|nr:hypothetical protein P692DRAFT_20830505 [Suillus brevipes Sb2]
MPKEDIDLPDLSGTIPSNAFHALAEVKQMSHQAMSPPDANLPDWSKLSGAVLSRASDALEGVKQLSNQTMSKKDIYLTNIDWSKVSSDILSNASNALTETKQLVHQVSMCRYWSSNIPVFQQYQDKLRRLIEMASNLLGVHRIKVWGTILSSASNLWDNTLRGASKLWGLIPSVAFRLWKIILWGPSKLWGTITAGSSKILNTVISDTHKWWGAVRIPSSNSDSDFRTTLSCVSHILTGVNIWSIRHPYIAAAVLLTISGNPDILLEPLQLTGKPAPCTRTSTIPLNSGYYETPVMNEYDTVDAHKAESTAMLSVSWLTGLGAVFVLGRTWGWWD